MKSTTSQTYAVPVGKAGLTLAAVVRDLQPGQSWKAVRKLIATRRLKINGELCLDSARRLRGGETLEILDQSVGRSRKPDSVEIRFLDSHLVVVEKPAGIATARHPAERAWSSKRRALSPTLEDLVPALIARKERGKENRRPPIRRLRIVHRLDKETSGLIVFARTVDAERNLGKQFHAHTVMRRYLALVPGRLESRKIVSRLVRDRGDGRRGSTQLPGLGKQAVTHVEEVEQLPGFTLVSCRLETGRTHQIRIHLAEAGHPICGEKVYGLPSGPAPPDKTGVPRLFLHAAELGFDNPATAQKMRWEMPLPVELEEFLKNIRERKPKGGK